jgi:hypothetical protein
MPPGSSTHISIRPRGVRYWLPDDRDCGRGQPGVPGVNIPDLDPDRHRAAGRVGCGPRRS